MTRTGPKTALQCALRYLSFRSRTESEVYRKLLASGFSEAPIASTLEKLKSQNLINDDALAGDWARLKTSERGYGPLFVERELRRRGVAGAVVKRVIAETFGSGQEVERAREIVERRFGGSNLSDAKMLKRAEGFLLRRGYNRSVITAVLAADDPDTNPYCSQSP